MGNRELEFKRLNEVSEKENKIVEFREKQKAISSKHHPWRLRDKADVLIQILNFRLII